jgi:hypothetical protein
MSPKQAEADQLGGSSLHTAASDFSHPAFLQT